MRKTLLLALMFFFAGIPHSFAAFSYERSITIDHTKVGSTNSTDYPVDVSLTDTTLKTVGNGGHVQNSNGYDIYFYSDSTLTTRIPAEREFYSATTGNYIGWAKVSTLSHTADTVIYIAYGDSSISSDPNSDGTYGATSVWTSFTSVYHFPDGTTLSTNDSTTANNGTNHSATAVSGTVDGAIKFVPNEYVDLGSNSSLQCPGVMTFSSWFTANSDYASIQEIACNASAPGIINNYCWEFGRTDNKFTFLNNNNAINVTSATSISDNNARYVAITRAGSSSNWTDTIYINGVSDASASSITQNPAGGTQPTALGRGGGFSGNYLNATLDEARLVCGTALSADWLLSDYNNQSGPGNIGTPGFYTVGNEVTPGVLATFQLWLMSLF